MNELGDHARNKTDNTIQMMCMDDSFVRGSTEMLWLSTFGAVHARYQSARTVEVPLTERNNTGISDLLYAVHNRRYEISAWST
jgi:hypothetical protein